MKNYVRAICAFVVMSAFVYGCSHPAMSPSFQPLSKIESLPSPPPKQGDSSFLPKSVEKTAGTPLPTSALNEGEASEQEKSETREPAKPLNVTPLIAFTKSGEANENYYSNCYTRILIHNSFNSSGDGVGDGKKLDVLPYSERWAIRRYAWGYKRDVSLTAKIRIGEYESTTPLIVLSHQSDKDGQYWCRSVSQMLLDFPLFLVKNDGGASIPDIRFSLVGNKDRQSNMAAIGLLAVTTAVQQVNPSARVLTKLTEQSTKDTARAVDGAIGKLFSSGIKEEHVTDCDFRTWDSKNGIVVELRIPKDEDGDWDTSDLRSVGKWIVSFDEPRPSIFSNMRICKNGNLCSPDRSTALKEVYKEVKKDPGRVLSYTLVKSGNGLGTIRAYLLQQKWFVSLLTAFKTPALGSTQTEKDAMSAVNVKTAETLCRNINDDITALGLNGDDAKIVIWATATALPDTVVVDSGAFKSDGAPTCQDAMRLFEL